MTNPEQGIGGSDKEKSYKLTNEYKDRVTRPYINRDDSYKEIVTQATSFLDPFLRSINGHTWISYGSRNDGEGLKTYAKRKDYDGTYIQYNPEAINPELVDFLYPKFKDKTVLDLGAGVRGLGYAIADSLEAGGYIGVELSYAKALEDSIEYMNGTTPSVILQEDMGIIVHHMVEMGEKVGVIFFSGIESTSYNGVLSLKEVIDSIVKILEDNGVMIVGGNLGYLEEELGDYIREYFEKETINVDGYIIYKKKAV